MNIHASFTGGNIRILKIDGADVYVQNEIRDTMEDWFYWAFCVEGAEGQTLTFHFDKKWLGYYGPAVSHDLQNWHWLGAPDETMCSDTFTYSFGTGESRVYFAHNMLYHPTHFDAFCAASGLQPQPLCTSERGREVPYLTFGDGDEIILLTARHHACEATGSYVLEGVIEELHREPIPGFRVIAVPFVDYDGVVDGDQGKSRKPYDHNRDYTPGQESLYASVCMIRKFAAEGHVRYAFDFHSPWHAGGMNDWVYIPQKHYAILKQMSRFAALFEKRITPESLPFDVTGVLPVDTDWNKFGTPCFGTYMRATAGAELAFTLETPYFSCSGTPFTADRAREMGRCFARGLRDYHNRGVRISFTGDILYPHPMNDWCQIDKGYDYLPLLKPLWARLPDTDYLVGNIETPVAGEANDGYTHTRYQFNTPDAALEALKKTGFDLISLANNHCMDRGQAGLVETVNACERAGLEHIGLYRTKEESEEIFVREIGGIRVGFINATYGTNAFAHHSFLGEDEKHMVKLTQPEETLAGSIHLLNSLEQIEAETKALYEPVQPVVAPYLERLKDEVQRTKAQCDFVVMLLHSGGQYNLEPDAYTKMLVGKLWEYGVDAIVGNHPHIILPSTYKDGRFTAYCLGNLMYSDPGYTKVGCPVNPDFSAVLNMTLEKKDGRIEPHFSFRLCQILFDPERKNAPRAVDTYDQYRKAPYPAYREAILYYANRFMPGMNYTEPMAEYPIA